MRKNIFLTGSLTFLFVLVDQWSKKRAIEFADNPFQIIPKFASLTYQRNEGIAFSLPFPRTGIIILTIILVLLGLYLARKYLNWQKQSTIFIVSLMLGGAIGNLIDRIFSSAIVDFISISRYPVFNLADMFLTGGVIIFLIYYFKKL